MQALNLPAYSFRIQTKKQKKYIFDDYRKKFVKLTSEEWVRQHFIRYLTHNLGYPGSLVAVEMPLRLNRIDFRADIVVYSRYGQPVLVVECKAPEVSINQQTFDQILIYNMQLQVRYLVVTNGLQHYCCRLYPEKGTYRFLNYIPDYSQLLEDSSSRE